MVYCRNKMVYCRNKMVYCRRIVFGVFHDSKVFRKCKFPLSMTCPSWKCIHFLFYLCIYRHNLLRSQRASLKRVSKAAILICIVGQFLKFWQAHCIVVVRSSVYSSAHHHNAMMGEPWISSNVFVICLWFTWYKDIFIRLWFPDFK